MSSDDVIYDARPVIGRKLGDDVAAIDPIRSADLG